MERPHRCVKKNIMPDDATNAALINYAGQVTSSSTNAMAQQKLNRKTMRYNDEWAYRQREWALADWDKQNEYNSPSSQMARLKAAGLNPNLVYGHGADAQSQGAPRSTASPSWNPKAPEASFSTGAALSMYYDIKMKKATLDNMEIQNKILQKDYEYKDLNVQGIYDYNIKYTGNDGDPDKPANYMLDKRDYEIQNARNRANLLMTQSEIALATREVSISQAFEKLAQLRIQNAKTEQEKKNLEAAYDGIKASSRLKELDKEFAETLHGRWDNYILKALGLLLNLKK